MKRQSDKLEEFVREHRESFEVFEPSDGLWDAISRRSKPSRKINLARVVWQVAAGIAIFFASWFIRDWIGPEGKEFYIAEEGLGSPADERMKMLMEAELYYSSKINTAREEIVRLSGDNQSLLELLNTDLVELDAVFEELKKDLKDEGDNQEVIEAMIQNYRLKLQILEEMRLQMQKSGNPEKKNEYEI